MERIKTAKRQLRQILPRPDDKTTTSSYCKVFKRATSSAYDAELVAGTYAEAVESCGHRVAESKPTSVAYYRAVFSKPANLNSASLRMD